MTDLEQTEHSVLVVHSINATDEQLDIGVEGVAPENLHLTYVTVSEGDSPDDIHEQVTAALEADDTIADIFVVEDGGQVSDWLEDLTLGDLRDFETNLTSSDGLVVFLNGTGEFDEDDAETDEEDDD